VYHSDSSDEEFEDEAKAPGRNNTMDSQLQGGLDQVHL